MKKCWMILGATLAALLVACGGQAPGGNGSGSGNVAAPNDVADVLAAANSQLINIEGPLTEAGIPVPTLPYVPFSGDVAAADTASWNCTNVIVTGNATDADRDSVPVNATYNGRCTWSYSVSGGGVSGYWEYQNVNIQDPNDRDPSAGVRVKGTVVWGFETADGSVGFTWKIVSHELVKSASGHNFNYEGSWTIAVDSATYTVNYNMSGTWSPDDPDDPWGNGTMTAEGNFSGSGPDCANEWKVDFSLNVLHFADCGIDSGQASYTVTDCDGASCTFNARWAGCGNVSYDGSCIGGTP